jgi:2-polyprenyl-6-methoxyphenol hydroxylase-like FAD-dependent oxidoreductase
MSRPLIELTVRRRVEQYNNITIREHCRVHDLASSPDGGTVSAVRFENSEGRSETLATDLVVEASGRGYLTNSVLESLGRAPPEETAIGVDITYATAVFTIPKDAPTDWKAVITFDAPAGGRVRRRLGAAGAEPLDRDPRGAPWRKAAGRS